MTSDRPPVADQTDTRADTKANQRPDKRQDNCPGQRPGQGPGQRPLIWVDADSFPAKARDLLLKTAGGKGLRVIYVANHDIPFSLSNPLFEMQICPQTPGAADDCIAGNCEPGDIAATRDIPLAARLVDKGVHVINDRGVRYDKRTVEKRLKERELSLQMEALGLHTGHSREGYGGRDLDAFGKCLHALLASLGL